MHMYLLTQKRPQGDLRATNRQDSTDPAVVVGPAISRTRKITFPAPSTSRSDLLGQLPMRAIGVGGLASRRSKRAVLSCLLRAEQAPRAPPAEALDTTALFAPPVISTLACRAKSRSETPAAPLGAPTSGLPQFCSRRDARRARKRPRHPQRSKALAKALHKQDDELRRRDRHARAHARRRPGLRRRARRARRGAAEAEST